MNDLSPSIWLLMSASLLGVLLLSQCATVGKPMRFNSEPTPETKDAKAKPAAAAKDAWFIETKEKPGGKPYSCSFVEFDGRGDFIDFDQYQAAWKKVKELGKDQGEKLLLVQYCHGWKNNSQSGDVVEFNAFLRLLANSPYIQQHGFRVHGLYLAWRGNVFKPAVDAKSPFYQDTRADYGEDIVNSKHHRWLPFFTFVGEQLSYWGRKRAAESDVAGAPLARAVLACANLTKKCGEKNRVFIIGHSMGALLLEKSVGQAVLGKISEAYPWFDDTPRVEEVNPTPFDLMLFVNSAAPSTHSKQLSDVLWGHQRALLKVKPKPPPNADAPLIMSLTSSADWATGVIHRVGNLLAFTSPSLQRRYSNVLEWPPGSKHQGEKPPLVHQSYYYSRTPGHNPLLVDHWIVPESAPAGPVPCAVCGDVLQHNLRRDVTDAEVFFSTPKDVTTQQPAKAWRMTSDIRKSDDPNWNKFHGAQAKERTSNYWTIRCPKELISGHNDIWNSRAMEMYAALYRLALWKAEN